MGDTTMSTEAMIALFAALVFGTATAAVAIINYEINASLVALDREGVSAAVCTPNWVAGYDASGAALYRGQLTRTCMLSQMQQSRS
jgi:hypothetical protein